MTDEHSHQEEHEPEPHARMSKDGEIEFLDEDGNWYKDEWESTGDPEKDRLMNMRASEFDKILEEPNHALYAKAAEIQADMMRPIVESIRKAIFPQGDPFKNLFGSWAEPLAGRWLASQGDLFRNLTGFEFRHPLPGWPAQGWNFTPGRTKELEDAAQVENLEEEPFEVEAEPSTTLEHSADSVDEPIEGAVVDPLVSAVATGFQMIAGEIDKGTVVNEQRRQDDFRAAEQASEQAKQALEEARKANNLAQDANNTAQSKLIVSVLALVVSAAAMICAVVAVLQ